VPAQVTQTPSISAQSDEPALIAAAKAGDAVDLPWCGPRACDPDGGPDGRTLILAGMPPNNHSPGVTPLLVVNTRDLTVRFRITLPGWSTVDAISPDGRWLYLIHYSANVSKYAVLGYDLLRHRMLPKPIVDPDDRGKAMTGFRSRV
jgi:hypothetical protein